MLQRKNSELLTKMAADENLADFLPDLGGVGSPRARAAALPRENRGKTQIQSDATAIQASG